VDERTDERTNGRTKQEHNASALKYGYIYRYEFSRLDRQWCWDYAIKFARWQHPAKNRGRGLMHMPPFDATAGYAVIMFSRTLSVRAVFHPSVCAMPTSATMETLSQGPVHSCGNVPRGLARRRTSQFPSWLRGAVEERWSLTGELSVLRSTCS